MPFDFDHPPERRGTDSVKWGRYAGRDVLPLWVADMDFAVAPAIVEALQRRVAHGVFGYAEPWPSLVEAVVEHLWTEYAWAIDPAWLVWLPGVVSGLHVASRAVGGGAFTATPIYTPFLTTSEQLATAPLRRGADRWEWDLEAAEAALTHQTRLFLLCHPHNPVGRAWDEAELRAIEALATILYQGQDAPPLLSLSPGDLCQPIAACRSSQGSRNAVGEPCFRTCPSDLSTRESRGCGAVA